MSNGAEYKDVKAILKKLDEFYIKSIIQQKHDDVSEDHKKHWAGIQSGINYARNTIIEAPIEDVVPESEVDELKTILNNYALQYGTVMDKQNVIDQAKREVAREVIEEFKNLVINYMTNKELLLTVFKNAITHAETELKKKYIGEGR